MLQICSLIKMYLLYFQIFLACVKILLLSSLYTLVIYFTLFMEEHLTEDAEQALHACPNVVVAYWATFQININTSDFMRLKSFISHKINLSYEIIYIIIMLDSSLILLLLLVINIFQYFDHFRLKVSLFKGIL